MPPNDVTRATLSVGAIAGALVWGLYRLATVALAGQPVHRQDLILAALNVVCAIVVGALVAWFMGPALTPLIPYSSLRDPHAVGFGLGAVAWELLPLVLPGARRAAARWFSVAAR